MGKYVEVDFFEFTSFFDKMGGAADDFKKEAALFMEGLGMEYLRIIQDEIKNRKVMDTRLLLHSFNKGGASNIWTISDGGLTLEVGSSLKYAKYVEEGHWTNKKGVAQRFVPGYWAGDRFIYQPGAKTGMVLKQKWIEGKHFAQSALRILEQMFPRLLEAKFEQWLESYF